MTTSNVELLPCPFCGGNAEVDTRQGFRAIVSGRMEDAVAVYCDKCAVQMMHCYSDHPGVERDTLRDDLTSAWNARANVEHHTEALRAEVGELHMHAKRRDQYAVEKAAQALDWKDRAERLAEALHRLEEACDDSEGAQYGTLGTAFVRGICKDALLREQEEGK